MYDEDASCIVQNMETITWTWKSFGKFVTRVSTEENMKIFFAVSYMHLKFSRDELFIMFKEYIILSTLKLLCFIIIRMESEKSCKGSWSTSNND